MSSAIKNLTKEELLDKYFEQEELINKLNSNINSLSNELSLVNNLFENSPTPIWEEDFSKIKKRIDSLKQSGINDFKQYIEDHPEILKEMATEIVVKEMNPASLRILEADSYEELSNSIPEYFDSDNAWEVFKNELVALANGESHFESEISIKTGKGNKKHLFLSLSVPSHSKNNLSSILVSVLDMTEIKESSLKIAENQNKYTSLVEQANEGIIIAQDGEIKYSNRFFYEMLGYTQDEILHVPTEKLLSNSENAKLIKNRFEERIKGESVPNIYEADAITKDGKIIPIEINARVMEYKGKPSVQSIVRDISNRKNAEAENKQKQKELDLIFNATSDIISLIKVEEDDLKLIAFNNSFWESVHAANSEINKEDLLNSSVYDSGKIFEWPKSFMGGMIGNYKKVLETLEPLESFETIPFGTITKHFSVKHTPIFNNLGACSHILLVVQDLTDKIHSEARSNFLATILKSSPISFIVTDLEGKIIDVNPALEKLTGYTKQEIIGLAPGLLNAEENADDMQADIMNTLAMENMWRGEIINKKKNGELFYNQCSIFPLHNESNEVIAYVSFNEDVTEKKKIEKTLIESEKFLIEVQNITRLGTYNFNISTGTWTSSEIMDRILGIDESFNRSTEGWISIIHPEWQQTMNEYLESYVVGSKNKFDKEYKIIRHRDKVERWVHGIGEVKYDKNGVPICMVGTITDITERINADNLIKEQDEYVKSIFSSAPVGIGVVKNRVFNKVNLKFCKMTGYKQEELIGKSSEMLYPTLEEFNRVGHQKYSQIDHVGSGTMETKFRTKDGNIINILLSSTPIDQNDLLKGVTFTALDITERIKAENDLLASRQRYESLFNNSPVPLWEESFKELYDYIGELRKQGINDFRKYFEDNINEVIKCSRMIKIESVNNATLLLHKAKNKGELLGNLEKVFTENSLKVFSEELITLAEGKNSFESEGEVKTLTGETIIIFLKFTILDNYKAILATVDITERRKAELALEKSESTLSTLMNNIPGMAYQCLDDDEWTMTFVTKESSNLLGLTPDQILQNKEFSYNNLIHPDDREYVRIKVEEKLETGEPYEIEYRIITEGSREKWVWERGTQINHKVDGYYVLEGVIHDITERKLAEKALNELAQFNHQILDAAMDGYILADTNGNIVDINPSYCQMIGYSEAELLNSNIKELEVEIPKEVFEERVKAMVSAGGVTFKTKHKHKKGYPIDLDVSITVINKDQETFIAALVRDITEQIKAAEKLKESEEKYRMLIENQNDLVVEIDNENKFKFVSPSYCKLFGKSETELLGNSFIPLVHEEDRIATEKEMENLFKEPFTCKVEQRAMTVNGWRWLEWHDKALYDENHNLISIYGVGRDITENKLASIALFQSEEKFRSLSNFSTIGIFQTDGDGKCLYTNPKWQEITGISFEEALGDGWTSTIHPDDSNFVISEWQNAVKENRLFELEFRFKKPDGGINWVQANADAVKSEIGKTIAYVGSYVDITEKKEAEIKLKESEEQFKQLFNNLKSGVAIYEAIDDGNDFILEDLNKAGEELSNVKKEKIIGEKITKTFPNVSGMGLLDVFKKVNVTNVPTQLPLSIYKDSRIERWYENYVYKLPTGKIVAIYEDTSVEKRALEALKNNEKDLRAILNTSFDAIVLINKSGAIIEANNVFCNLVNKERDELLDIPIFNYIKSENVEERKTLLNEIFKTKKYVNYTDEAFGRIWDFGVYPILGDDGEVSRLSIFAKDVTEKSVFEKKLKETNERLRNLTRYTNNVREEERKNFAREVHDNLGQKLTALNLDISWIKQNIPDELAEMRKQFDPVLDLINQSIITVQKISTELRPGILDDLGLVNAIQWQSNEISRRTELNFSLNLYKNEIALDDNVKTALFRVFQEALTNIVRHAKASNILVNLLIKENKLIFEVIDDGIGISESEINEFTSFGIIGMKERIASIDGEIFFSRLSKGTMLRINVPVKAKL